jgi:hypothetical protein
MNSDLFLIISEKDHYCFLSDFENALLTKGGADRRGDLTIFNTHLLNITKSIVR